MTIKPSEVFIHEIGVLTDTLGKAELEAAAALLVRYYVVNGLEEWTAVTRSQLANFLQSDPVARDWTANPFWRPSPHGLIDGGWVTGWETPDAPGTVTPKFLEAVANPGSWRKGKHT